MIAVRIEHPRGPAGASSPAIVKHAVRMCSRLRKRNIWPVDPPAVVETSASAIMIRAGNRVMVVDNTGACRASLRPVDGIFDRQATIAHYNRTHALWLTFAAEDRRRGFTNIVRGHITLAMHDRLTLKEYTS